jgi:hypothetical protein
MDFDLEAAARLEIARVDCDAFYALYRQARRGHSAREASDCRGAHISDREEPEMAPASLRVGEQPGT